MKEHRQYLIACAAIVLFLVWMGAQPVVAQPSGNSSRPAQELGIATIADASTSQSLSAPTGTTWAIISVRDYGAHFSFDGTAATTSNLFISPGVFRLEDKTLIDLVRIITSTDGATKIYVTYMGPR